MDSTDQILLILSWPVVLVFRAFICDAQEFALSISGSYWKGVASMKMLLLCTIHLALDVELSVNVQQTQQ